MTVKYPKYKTEKKLGDNEINQDNPEVNKYTKIAEATPEVIAVTKREKRLEDLKKDEQTEVEKQLEKQSLLARIMKAVKKW